MYEKWLEGKKKWCEENVFVFLQNGLTHTRKLTLNSPLELEWTAPASLAGHLEFRSVSSWFLQEGRRPFQEILEASL